MRKVLACAAAAAAMAFSGAANAGVIVMTNSTDTVINGGTALQFSNSEVTLTVKAGVFTQTGQVEVVAGAYGARPVAYSPGLGVLTNNDNSHTIDGSGRLEAVILEFSQNVIITGLTFGYFDGDDDFEFFFDLDMDGIVERVLSNIDIPNSGFIDMTGLFGDAGTLFGVGANHSSDSFKLKKVYYELAPEVPLPAALPLFLAGAAGVGFASRRRKGAAKA